MPTRTSVTAPRRPANSLLYNGDFEFAPSFTAAQTNTQWIVGTASGSATNGLYGWGVITQVGTIGVQFDSSQFHSGTNSMKLSLGATGARIEVQPRHNGTSIDLIAPCAPSTSYTMGYWMKTNLTSGTSTTGARGGLVTTTANGSFLANANGTAVLTTTGWTFYTVSITTGATARFIAADLILRGNDGAATLIMDAWFDDVTLAPTAGIGRSVAGARTLVS